MARPKLDANKVAIAIREFTLACPVRGKTRLGRKIRFAKVSKRNLRVHGSPLRPHPEHRREAPRVPRPSARPRVRDAERLRPGSRRLGEHGLAGRDRPSLEVLCDWVEESYRTIAPKKLIAELDAAHDE